jgi:transposase
MSRAYSLDLRERVVTAVEKGGLSARRAAVQFGVDASTAIRWVGRLRRTGSVRPSKIGGYTVQPQSQPEFCNTIGAKRTFSVPRLQTGL